MCAASPNKDLLLHLAAPCRLGIEEASKRDESILTELSSLMPEATISQPSKPAGSISQYLTQCSTSLTPSLSSVMCPIPEPVSRNLVAPQPPRIAEPRRLFAGIDHLQDFDLFDKLLASSVAYYHCIHSPNNAKDLLVQYSVEGGVIPRRTKEESNLV
jgi:hypothetical protein